MISYVMPTHGRPDVLAETLSLLGGLERHDAQVVVVDNASTPPALVPRRLDNGLRVDAVRLDRNIGTAARNAGVRHAVEVAGRPAHDSHWIVMLDDDSAPTSTSFLAALAEAGPEVAVIAAEVFLPTASSGIMRHEAGGLPEVFIGCGAAIRAGVFESLGGYDSDFDYYAEEYDLSARVLLAGLRVAYDRRFTVLHRKVERGRDMSRILANLVRNNAWVMARYAPEELREQQVNAQTRRYAQIAEKEGAVEGYERGMADLRASLSRQPRRPLSPSLWQRFTGYEAARNHLSRQRALGRVAIMERGKNDDVVENAAHDCGLVLTTNPRDAETILVGTLSPGPMLDAAARLRGTGSARVVTPWALGGGVD